MDASTGISVQGQPPFNFDSWRKYFKELTVGKKNNAVVMGRKTFEMFQKEPLSDRDTFVISKNLKQNDFTKVIIYTDFCSCLIGIHNKLHKYDSVFVIGGAKIFTEAVNRYLYLCNIIYSGITNNETYECDSFFPLAIVKKNSDSYIENKNRDYTRVLYRITIVHQEEQYLDVIREILNDGFRDRNDNKFITDKILRYDLETEIPIITSRYFDINELLEEISEDLQNMDFVKENLGFRLRCSKEWNGPTSYSEKCDDLLRKVIEKDYCIYIKRYVTDTDKSWPIFVNFFRQSNKYLNCTLNFDTVEIFEEFPWYLAYFSVLLNILSFFSNLKPKNISVYIVKGYILSENVEFCKRIEKNTPRPCPLFHISNPAFMKTFEDIDKNSFEIKNYNYSIKINKKNKNNI